MDGEMFNYGTFLAWLLLEKYLGGFLIIWGGFAHGSGKMGGFFATFQVHCQTWMDLTWILSWMGSALR